MTLDELAGDPEFRDLVAEAVLLLEGAMRTRCCQSSGDADRRGSCGATRRGRRRRAVRAWQPTGESVRRCGWSSRRRSRSTSAWSRRWRTKRARATAVPVRRCTGR